MATDTPPATTPQLPTALHDDPLDPTLTAISTLSLLDLRLSRLEFLLTGSSHQPSLTKDGQPQLPPRKDTPNIPSQLRSLETRLTTLKRLDGIPGNLVRMIDSLRREYPEIFPATSRSFQTQVQATEQPLDGASASVATPKHDLSNRAQEVLSHSTLYTTTSAHLQTLQALKIPPAAHSANLVNAGPRLARLRRRQEEVNAEVAELKGRSAGVLEWWVKNGVVGMGELWEDWEDRVGECEKQVRRGERRRREERG